MKPSAIAKIWITALIISLIMASAAVCATISQDQKDQLKELATQTRQKTGSERQNLSRGRQDLLAIYSNYDLNERKARATIDTIEQSQLKLLNIHFENQIGIRNILKASQFAQFKEKLGTKMRGRGMSGKADADIYADKSLLDGLNMSVDQRQKAQSRLGELAKRRANMIRNMRLNFKKMMSIYSDYNLDKAAAKKLISKTHKQQSALLELNLKRQEAIRSLLTESQFNAFMSKVSSKMKNQPGQRGKWRGNRNP